MDSTKESQNASKQACDNCRRRKIKCSRDFPCDKCQRLMLKCSYGDVLRRKGPKFRTLYPLAPSHPLASRGEHHQGEEEQQQQPQLHYTASNTGHDGYNAEYMQPDAPSAPSASILQYQYPPLQLSSPPESSSTTSDYSCNAGQVPRPYARRLTSPILLAHVNVYLKYLFPIMPVVRREALHRDSHHPNHLSPQRYAFLAALCAATHIQLKLDGGPSPASDSNTATAVDVDGHGLMSGDELLAEAVRARNECEVVEDMNVESLLTSFFLFACYGNLDKQRQAWFYLCQTTSMAFELGLHRESTYTGLGAEEAEEKRRVFWLLFVTERGYALQQSRPVMLRSSIHKPQVLCSDDPILAYGFLNLINLFEKLTVNLYDWISAGGCDEHDSFQVPPAASSIQSSLCNAPIASLQGVLEIQQVDILITQQWLQAMMWKLSMGHAAHAHARATQSGSSDGGNDILPFHLPVIVGKAVMGVIGAASQGAVDAHGIGMEQKLYDLGTTVAKVTNSYTDATSTTSKQTPKPPTLPNLHLTESTTDPRELLWGILTTLSRIRGSQSYLFPDLLEQCKPIFGLDCLITIGDFLPTLGTTTPTATAAISAATAATTSRNIDSGTAPQTSWASPKANNWGLLSAGAEEIPTNNDIDAEHEDSSML